MRRLSAVALMLVFAGCSGVQMSQDELKHSELPTKPNFFLRVAFDQDPSVFLGRFVPEGAKPADIDETAAMQTPCSKFFTIKKVPVGGVEFDEYFTAGASAAANIGIPPVAFEASATRTKVVRVKYTATEKWIANLDDPEGFQRCCMQAPGQCTDRFIGEFLSGTGEIFAGYMEGSEASANYTGVTKQAGAEIKDGVTWRRAVAFKNPVFFAFKTSENRMGVSGVASGQCQHQFRNAVPKSPLGLYFVGVSDWMPSERVAREQAELDARTQVIRFLGEQIVQGGRSVEVTQGQVDALQVALNDERSMKRMSSGVARYVKDECWENDTTTSPDGTKYQARVLVFFPNEEVDAAKKAVLEEAK